MRSKTVEPAPARPITESRLLGLVKFGTRSRPWFLAGIAKSATQVIATTTFETWRAVQLWRLHPQCWATAWIDGHADGIELWHTAADAQAHYGAIVADFTTAHPRPRPWLEAKESDHD